MFKKLSLTSVRGFTHVDLNLSRTVNIFVGPNNSGKSTLLNALMVPQKKLFQRSDIAYGAARGDVHIDITSHLPFTGLDFVMFKKGFRRLHYRLDTEALRLLHDNRLEAEVEPIKLDTIPEVEPNNLIYPYFSRRKVDTYSEEINTNASTAVSGSLKNLTAKIDRIADSNFRAHEKFVQSCEAMLGFRVSAVASEKGKKVAYIVDDFGSIPITSMGEGVASLLGLIVDLCIAENKIFIIEEPENDIHPKALRALLDLIREKSETNQFFISTHSHIVLKHLGSGSDAKIFRTSTQINDSRIFRSDVEEVVDSPTARRELLAELGYEFYDYDLFGNWLFLEESSAETVINDFLIPQFVPRLAGKIRTFSAGGVTNLRPRFEDFNRLFVFLHLDPIYKNRVWVLLDGGEAEKKIRDDMASRYARSGWRDDMFVQLTEHEFESYYPPRFQERVSAIRDAEKEHRRNLKAELVEDVKTWFTANPAEAKVEFETSSQEVIEILKMIDSEISGH